MNATILSFFLFIGSGLAAAFYEAAIPGYALNFARMYANPNLTAALQLSGLDLRGTNGAFTIEGMFCLPQSGNQIDSLIFFNPANLDDQLYAPGPDRPIFSYGQAWLSIDSPHSQTTVSSRTWTATITNTANFSRQPTEFDVATASGTDAEGINFPLSSNTYYDYLLSCDDITAWTYVAFSVSTSGVLTLSSRPGRSSSPSFVAKPSGGIGNISSFTPPTFSYLGYGANSSFIGTMDEIRIWNYALNQSTLQNHAFKKILSNTPGLLAQFSFDDPNDLLKNNVPNSPITATLVDMNPPAPTSEFQPRPVPFPQVYPNYSQRSLIRTQEVTVGFGASITLTCGATGSIAGTPLNLVISSQTLPLNGTLNPPSFTNVLAPFNVTFTAINPDLCSNTTQTLSWISPNSSSISASYIIRIIGSPSFTSFIYPTNDYPDSTTTGMSTTGGSLTISGIGLGFDGNSSLTFVIDGLLYNCINPDVTNGGTSFTCTMPAGVGGNIISTYSVCTQQVSVSGIKYLPPLVESITVDSTIRTLSIAGSNFGPNNTQRWQAFQLSSNFKDKVFIGSTGFECILTSLDHNLIVCSLGDQVGDLNSNDFLSQDLNMTIGGQQAIPRVEDGLRVGGPNFKKSQSDNTALIAGLVGGIGGCCCLLLIIIAIFVVVYQRKKSTFSSEAPFIPVEKRDFTNIIFGSEPVQGVKKTAQLEQLEKLLVEDPEYKLALEIADSQFTQITEADNISKSMVIVFENNSKTLEMLKLFIKEEVNSCKDPATLFRANSMVSKMFKFYSRLIGLPYLYITIGKTINQLMFEKLGIEVDPEKMVEGEDLNEMRWTLMAQSQKILKFIRQSAKICPVPFRHLCVALKEAVSEKYPDHVDKTIGGFIFLRFFCPAVTSPEVYGIVDDPPTAESRRLLILITKSLQNLASDVEFGSKEPYMTNMNEFIKENRGVLHEFYEKLMHSTSDNTAAAILPKGVADKSLQDIADHISMNLDKIKNQELRRKLQEILTSTN